MWYRFRFRANYDDSRPVIFPPPGPSWESGLSCDESYAIRIAYLPENSIELLKQYWPEAEFIDLLNTCEKITFTDRFPKPDWWHDKIEE